MSQTSRINDGNSEKVVSSVSQALRAVWWIPLIRGIFLVILGLLLMMAPLATIKSLVLIFGIFLALDGLVAAAHGFANRDQKGWQWWLVQGGLDLLFAAIIVIWPGMTATVLFYLLLVWTIALGVTAIIGAAALMRNKDLGWPWMLTFGLLSTLFGVTVLGRGVDTTGAALLVALVFGIYACVLGAVQIVSAFSVRATARDIDEALRGNSAVLDALVERRVAKLQEDAAKAAAHEAEKAAAQAEKEAQKLADAAAKQAEKEATQLPDSLQ